MADAANFMAGSLTKEQVFGVVVGERDYQDARWNASTTPTEGKHSVAEFVLFMEEYLGYARKALSTQASPQAEIDGLDMVRKVTAMGFSCMEQNGAVRRPGF